MDVDVRETMDERGVCNCSRDHKEILFGLDKSGASIIIAAGHSISACYTIHIVETSVPCTPSKIFSCLEAVSHNTKFFPYSKECNMALSHWI